MTQEEYNQLDSSFAHCAGTNCERADQCLCHTAYKILGKSSRATYTTTNLAVITGKQPCALFVKDHRELYAWGISHIYDNVRTTDFYDLKHKVMSCFGSASYYPVKEQRRAINEEEQRAIREAFTEMGYDGKAIEFDRYEESYPMLMRMKNYK